VSGTGSTQPREQFEELLGINSSGSGSRKSKLRSEGLVKELDRFGDLDIYGCILAYYKKLWEELIAYFILILRGQHGMHRPTEYPLIRH
jgi:hypothetical protein